MSVVKQMSAQDEQRIREVLLAKRLEYFIAQWQPSVWAGAGEYDDRNFKVELYALMDNVRAVAQQPLIEQMSAALMRNMDFGISRLIQTGEQPK